MPSLVELIFTAVGSDEVARQVGKVNSGLGDMIGSLGKAATAALSVDYAWNKLNDAIGDAANFQRLSLRIGESIRDTVLLEQAFRNAGLGAELIGTSANMLERALGGVNEKGEKTDVAFRRIGTSIAELKPLTYAEQLQVLSDGFGKLANVSDRVNVARQLFGRGGGQLLQLLGDPNAISLAREQAGGLADQVERNAGAAVELQRQLNGLTARSRELWQAMAAQLLPTLRSIAELMGSGHDSAGTIGAFLGAAGPGALMAGGLFFGLNQIDRALYSTLEKMEAGTARSIVRGASNAMADAVAWTPVGLAAAVTAQIVLGIIAAWQDEQIQKIFAEMHQVSGAVQPFRDRATKINSPEEWQALVFDVTQRLATIAADRDRLQAQATIDRTKESNAFSTPDSQLQAEEKQRELVRLGAYLRNVLLAPGTAALQIAENQLNRIKAELAPYVAQIPELQKKVDEQRLKEKSPLDQTIALQQRRQSLERQLANSPAGLNDDEETARRLKIEHELLKVQIEEHQAAQKLGEELKHHSDEAHRRVLFELELQRDVALAAGRDEEAAKLTKRIALMRAAYELQGADLEQLNKRIELEDQLAARKTAEKNAHEALQAERRTLEDALTAIRERLSDLESDYGRTDAAKWAERKKAIAEEIATLQAQIKADQLAAAREHAAGHSEAAATFEQSASDKGRQLAGVQHEGARLGADPLSLSAQMRRELTALQNQFGTIQENIAHSFGSVITTAMQSTSAGLQKLIGDTEYWSKKLGNIAGPIMGALTKSIADMFATWITQRGVAALKNILFSEEEGTADAVAKAPGAVLTSISSFGVAAAIGVAAVLAALAAFDVGGYTAHGPASRPAGVVHAGEWVAPQWQVNHPMYGPMIAMLEAARQGEAGYGLGGFVSWLFPTPKQLFDRTIHPPGQRELASLFSYKAPAIRSAGRPDFLKEQYATAWNGPGSGSGAGGRDQAQNHYWFFDRSKFRAALAADMRGIAHDVFDERTRKA